jgi:succinate dehydrogenase / fumarate reductase cytochrome b subunit
LLAVAGDGPGFGQFNRFAGSLPGMVLMAALVFSLVYHLFNGIRHLLWDVGWGFEIPQFYASGWVVLALTAAFTVGVVVLALLAGGVA